MKKIAIMVCVALLLCSCRFIVKSTQKSQITVQSSDLETCIEKWKFAEHSYSGRMRDRYRYLQSDVIIADRISSRHKSFTFTEDFFVAGHPLLFVNRDRSRIVVDNRYFTTLRRVDIPRLRKEKVVGNLLVEQPELFRDFERFLCAADILRTYWHTESYVCLTKEIFTDKYYQAFFSAKHVYFTNGKNEKFYRFSVKVFTPSGKIVVSRD